MNGHPVSEGVPENGAVRFECDLTVENVASLKVLVMASLKEREELVIDMSGIKDIDVAGLQLLCSAHKTALNMNKQFLLIGDGLPLFRQAVKDSGYTRNEGCASHGQGNCPWIGGEKDG